MTGYQAKSVCGYADQISVAAGDTVHFKISCYRGVEYSADLVRIVSGDTTPGGAGFEEHVVESPFSGQHTARKQDINIGSYGLISVAAKTAEVDRATAEGFSLQAMIYPTTLTKGRQGILGNWCPACGSGASLIIDPVGCLGLIFTDRSGKSRSVSSAHRLSKRRWQLVSASYDAKTDILRLSQWSCVGHANERLKDEPFVTIFAIKAGIKSAAPKHFVFAGLLDVCNAPEPAGNVKVTDHYNGKLDRPRWSAGALLGDEIKRRNHEAVLLDDATLGCWDFSKDITSDWLSDVGPLGLHGHTVNLPARAVTGFNWDGSEHNWLHAPEQYGALQFHDTDLYDAGWDTDFSYCVPQSLPGGIYAARITLDQEVDRIPFIVRRSEGELQPPIALVMSTATYMAYGNNLQTANLTFEVTQEPNVRDEVYLTLQGHPEFGRSTYDCHSDGTGVRYSSRLRPLIDVRPGTTKMWSFNADILIATWLERSKYKFDVLTDEDLHRGGAKALSGYQVVITGSHPEYMSLKIRDAFDGVLAEGGRLMYLGGNGFYLRVAYSDEFPGAIELRRVATRIPALWSEEVGEHYHSFTGELGGGWQQSEHPPYQSVGVGFANLLMGKQTCYRRDPTASVSRTSFIFEGVDGDVTNEFGEVYGTLSADEFDRCQYDRGSPLHAIVVASSLQQKAAFSFEEDYQADMVFFECKSGGAVFSTSTISWGLGLNLNERANDVSRVTSNVLNRFLDPTPFTVPSASQPDDIER